MVIVRLQRPPRPVPNAGPLKLRYSVRNGLAQPIFAITGPATVQPRSGPEIHIILGENPIPDDAYYFNYEPPTQRLVGAGQELHLSLTVELPLWRLIEGSRGDVREVVVPLFGNVEVYLTVGFTRNRFRGSSSDPASELIRRQALTAPATVTVNIR